MAAAGVLAALALLLIVPGCQRGGGKTEPVKAADNAARVAYLEGLGWQVTPETPGCYPPCSRAARGPR